MKRLLATTAIVCGALWFHPPAAYATPAGSLIDSWSVGTATHVTGSLPTLTLSGTTTSNDGYITPRPDPYTQTGLSLNTTTSVWGFVAVPKGSGVNKADIPISFTISDGGTGTKTFTVWMDYYANFGTDIDSMSWSSSPVTPGYTTSGSFSASETLSDNEVLTFTVPYETDWDMAQAFQFDVTALPTADAPEPMSIALLGFGLLGTAVFARRRRA